ncbi:MAG: DUF6717 family protein [Bacteroidota bacterium]
MLIKTFEFQKNNKSEWYILLPGWKGDPEDLQMVEGADEWLDVLSNKGSKLILTLSDKNFEGAEVLALLRLREENLGGGGIYYFESYKGERIGLKLWLCEVTRFVFKNIPQRIYFEVEDFEQS